MSVSKEEFDRIHLVASRLKMIFVRDGASIPEGYEDYIVRSVEEATRLTQRAPDACPVCLGSGVRITKLTGVQTKCRSCHGTGQRR